jgi:hypothetical protein
VAGVREVYRKLQAAKEVLPVIAENAIDKTKKEWIELNQDQMLRGQDRNGDLLGKYKNSRYAKMKNQLNPLPGLGNKDYRLHGDYYKGMFLVVDNGVIRQGSEDEKAQWLEKNKDQRYGLQPENKKDYIREFLRPLFNELFLQKLR